MGRIVEDFDRICPKLKVKRDILIGQIQTNYKIEKKAAEKKVEVWEKTHDPRLIFDFIL